MRFECQESCGGKCCSFGWSGGGFIFLTKADRSRIQLHTGKRVADFAKRGYFDSTRFTQVPTQQYYLDQKEGLCIFFKGGKCSVYSHRPTQCRTFPYWPEIVQLAHNQQEFAKVCPGIGVGEEDDKKKASMMRLQSEADMEMKTNFGVTTYSGKR